MDADRYPENPEVKITLGWRGLANQHSSILSAEHLLSTY
jgi:hypothetical protein